jgi:predicted dehydrogenase
METTMKNVGLIEYGSATITSLLQDVNLSNGYQVKKILATQKSTNRIAKDHYPDAELVSDSSSIINDSTIELIIIAGTANSDLGVVAQAVGAGKQVRVL